MDKKEQHILVKKYPFLEDLVKKTTNLFTIKEESSTKYLDTCVSVGYHYGGGETTDWIWYGIKDNKVLHMEERSVEDAILNNNYDYVATIEHITTDLFEDDTIRFYDVRGYKR